MCTPPRICSIVCVGAKTRKSICTYVLAHNIFSDAVVVAGTGGGFFRKKKEKEKVRKSKMLVVLCDV